MAACFGRLNQRPLRRMRALIAVGRSPDRLVEIAKSTKTPGQYHLVQIKRTPQANPALGYCTGGAVA